MNTLITGDKASGKSTVASKLSPDYWYEYEGDGVFREWRKKQHTHLRRDLVSPTVQFLASSVVVCRDDLMTDFVTWLWKVSDRCRRDHEPTAADLVACVVSVFDQVIATTSSHAFPCTSAQAVMIAAFMGDP